MNDSVSSASVCRFQHIFHALTWLTYNETESGAQPLTNADESIILAVNGEIYNHRLIRKGLTTPYHFKTTSDCEVIIPLVSPAAQRLAQWELVY